MSQSISEGQSANLGSIGFINIYSDSVLQFMANSAQERHN